MDKLSTYIQSAADRFAGSPAEEYILARGISKETAKKYQLGHTEMPPAFGEALISADALLIPTSSDSYIMRSVDENCTHANRYRNSFGGTNLFNEGVLNDSESTVFITEGAIDALSIIECGGEAVGLNSTSAVGRLLAILENNSFSGKLIIAMDQDDAGRKATVELEARLKKQKIQYCLMPNWGGCKDANELLIKDKNALINLVSAAKELADRDNLAIDEKDRELLNMIDKCRMSNCVSDMLAMIEESANRPRISTGIAKLDSVLEGGLLPGLHIVAAMSSLGKTTWVLQMVANIARQGHDVILYSLEMSRLDLFAKNISRIGFELDMNYRLTSALSTSGILAGVAHQTSNSKVKLNFQRAVEEYRQYADKLLVIDGANDIGAKDIKDFVENYIRLTGRKPIVVVDYIQLLHPADARLSEKQNIDYSIKCLKQLVSHGVSVIAISSLNRQSYDAPVSLSSLKESGNLEYSAETVLALDFDAMYDAVRMGNPKAFNLNTEKEREARNVVLTVLKNRNGPTGKQISLVYYPKFNLFIEK